MRPIWYFIITVWHEEGLNEYLLEVDVNKIDIDFEFWGEYQEDILRLLGCRSCYKNPRILKCEQHYFEKVTI